MKLKDYLEDTHTSAPSFAELVGVTATTVYRWLSRTRWPQRRDMIAINKVTKGAVTPNDLILGDA